MSELVFIRAYSSRFEAEQAQQYLLQQGIQAWVKADDGGGMYPGLSLGRKGVRLLVHEDDVEAAEGALEPGEVVDLVEATSPGAGSEFVPAPMVAAETAANFFAAGHNCAEAVLLTFAVDWNMPTMVRLATGFGGGMGRAGEACGAIAGAIMALGARFGRSVPDDEEAKERCYEAVGELLERFRDAQGHVTCRDLTGLDLATEAGRRKAEDRDLRGTVCRESVRAAAGIAAEIMARE
jgi:C_GCAxxG_C_C family probable redox protein